MMLQIKIIQGMPRLTYNVLFWLHPKVLSLPENFPRALVLMISNKSFWKQVIKYFLICTSGWFSLPSISYGIYISNEMLNDRWIIIGTNPACAHHVEMRLNICFISFQEERKRSLHHRTSPHLACGIDSVIFKLINKPLVFKNKQFIESVNFSRIAQSQLPHSNRHFWLESLRFLQTFYHCHVVYGVHSGRWAQALDPYE